MLSIVIGKVDVMSDQGQLPPFYYCICMEKANQYSTKKAKWFDALHTFLNRQAACASLAFAV